MAVNFAEIFPKLVAVKLAVEQPAAVPVEVFPRQIVQVLEQAEKAASELFPRQKVAPVFQAMENLPGELDLYLPVFGLDQRQTGPCLHLAGLFLHFDLYPDPADLDLGLAADYPYLCLDLADLFVHPADLFGHPGSAILLRLEVNLGFSGHSAVAVHPAVLFDHLGFAILLLLGENVEIHLVTSKHPVAVVGLGFFAVLSFHLRYFFYFSLSLYLLKKYNQLINLY